MATVEELRRSLDGEGAAAAAVALLGIFAVDVALPLSPTPALERCVAPASGSAEIGVLTPLAETKESLESDDTESSATREESLEPDDSSGEQESDFMRRSVERETW